MSGTASSSISHGSTCRADALSAVSVAGIAIASRPTLPMRGRPLMLHVSERGPALHEASTPLEASAAPRPKSAIKILNISVKACELDIFYSYE